MACRSCWSKRPWLGSRAAKRPSLTGVRRRHPTGFLYFDRQIFDFGKSLKITMGGGDASGVIFQGRVMGMEGRYLRSRPPELLVLAEDRLQDLRLTRRTRTFENLSDANLFQQVASQYGLQTNIDANGPTYRVLAQINQSDLAFLRERARAIDAELWIDDSTLNVKSRNRRETDDVTLTFGQGLLEVLGARRYRRPEQRVCG